MRDLDFLRMVQFIVLECRGMLSSERFIGYERIHVYVFAMRISRLVSMVYGLRDMLVFQVVGTICDAQSAVSV